MTENIFSVLDIIQIVLMLLACWACYVRGRVTGMQDMIEELADRGVLDLEKLEEEET
mgnify:CR=1 FL=1|jgi:hypothetical protein